MPGSSTLSVLECFVEAQQIKATDKSCSRCITASLDLLWVSDRQQAERTTTNTDSASSALARSSYVSNKLTPMTRQFLVASCSVNVVTSTSTSDRPTALTSGTATFSFLPHCSYCVRSVLRTFSSRFSAAATALLIVHWPRCTCWTSCTDTL